jgi:hypothetical protein
MTERMDTLNRWTKVSPDLFAVLSADGYILMVGWRRDDGQPVTCAMARLTRKIKVGQWASLLLRGFEYSSLRRDATCRAAAIAAVAKYGGVVLRHEDREPHLKVF